jgi:hypothetical protein
MSASLVLAKSSGREKQKHQTGCVVRGHLLVSLDSLKIVREGMTWVSRLVLLVAD